MQRSKLSSKSAGAAANAVRKTRRLGSAAARGLETLESRILLSTVDHSGGFPAGGTDLMLNGAAGISIGATTMNTLPISNALQLTDANGGETNSAFDTMPQGVDTFDTTFDFTYGAFQPQTDPTLYAHTPDADGFTFTIQNSGLAMPPESAVGGGGGDLAYVGIPTSVAVKFDLYDGNPMAAVGGPAAGNPTYNATGVYVNGTFPAPGSGDDPRQGVDSGHPAPIGNSVDLKTNSQLQPTGIDFHANQNDKFHCELKYDGTTLTETVTDTTKNVTVTQTYTIDIPGIVGGHTATVGFTAATGGAWAEQDILDWKYTGTAGTGAVTLPAPVLSGSPCLSGVADISWTEPSALTTGFELDESVNGGAFSKLATLPAPADSYAPTTYSATGLDPTKTYQFRVTALGDGATTLNANSNAVSIDGGGIPSPPIDFSGGFTGPGASDMQLNGSASLTGAAPTAPTPAKALQLTPNTPALAGSAFDKNEQIINKFDTSFDFVYPTESSPPANGFAFVIQNSIAGPKALGGSAGGLGYGTLNVYQGGIANSVAIKFDLFDTGGEGTDSTGLFANGDLPSVPTGTIPAEESDDMTSSGVVLGNTADKYHVHLTYDGTTLHEEVDDVTKGKTFTHDYKVDLTQLIGDACGFVGFTGGTGGGNGVTASVEQDITDWTFTGNPPTTGGPKDVINDPTGGNTITLKQDATNHAQIDWTLGAQSGNLPITDAKGLTINDAGAADTIVLDASNGNPLPNLLTLNGSFAINGSLSVGANQSVVLGHTTSANTNQLSVGGLTLDAASTLDLNNSKLLIHYSSSSPLAAIEGYLSSGSDNGKWDGKGIVSSDAKANPKFGVADTDSADPLVAGQPQNTILLSYALVGDLNLSHKVDFTDFVTLARNYNKTGADWAMGDFNYNGKIDFGDLVSLARNYNQTGPAVTALAGAAAADTGSLQKASRRPLSIRLA